MPKKKRETIPARSHIVAKISLKLLDGAPLYSVNPMGGISRTVDEPRPLIPACPGERMPSYS